MPSLLARQQYCKLLAFRNRQLHLAVRQVPHLNAGGRKAVLEYPIFF